MSTNPFDELIEKSKGDAKVIHDHYHLHRINRNNAQREKILDPSFNAFAVDEVLARLEDPGEADYTDPRHCFVFWARPTANVKKLAGLVQERLQAAFPNIWLMPEGCMHMTALEVTHSRTDSEIQHIISQAKDALPAIADFTYDHRARLIQPYLGFDSTAIALSYLPAAAGASDDYTYHHLRRDLFAKCAEAGIDVQSRYVATSAHLTMARFINQKEFVKPGTDELDPEKVKKFIAVLEEINQWLEKIYWPTVTGSVPAGGEWLVGEDRGLTVREGQLWYGGGKSLHEGRGF